MIHWKQEAHDPNTLFERRMEVKPSVENEQLLVTGRARSITRKHLKRGCVKDPGGISLWGGFYLH